MSKRRSVLLASIACLALIAADAPAPRPTSGWVLLDNPAIDARGFLADSLEALERRESRRLTEAEFARRAALPGTIVLDARSRDRYRLLHVDGAISLPFTDFTAASLAAAIPDRTTPILIYCNNNFEGDQEAFASKSPSASLNLSTFTALHTYGYENVWELGPLLDVATTKLRLVPSPATTS